MLQRDTTAIEKSCVPFSARFEPQLSMLRFWQAYLIFIYLHILEKSIIFTVQYLQLIYTANSPCVYAWIYDRGS